MRKFDELCAREGKGRGDYFLGWVADHVQKHYPGNPQTLITYQQPFNRPKPPTLQIKLVAREIRGYLATIQEIKSGKRKVSDYDRPTIIQNVLEALSKRAVKLEGLNGIIQGEEYSKILEEVDRVLAENKAI